ncbi:hypothetical protein [Microvirga mediterraneensis]|uniref:P-type ATPase n=1 Tax=Microvirga mediterraneensis TaxID=2754695 RepID=UPI003CCDE5D3
MIAPHALVLRNGQRTKVAVRDLVPGDIVFLEAGDRVPADLRLLRARRLPIDEALLTDESVAVEKEEAPVPEDASLGAEVASPVSTIRRRPAKLMSVSARNSTNVRGTKPNAWPMLSRSTRRAFDTRL